MLHRRLKIADGDNGNDNLWQQRRQQGWRDRRREEEEEVTIMKKMGDDGDESLRCRWLLQLAIKMKPSDGVCLLERKKIRRG